MTRRSRTAGALGGWPRLFHALADPTRLRILKLLIQRPEFCVSEVAKALGLSVPAASQQLKVLEHAGFVRKVRLGQKTCHELRLNDHAVRALLELTLSRRLRPQTVV